MPDLSDDNVTFFDNQIQRNLKYKYDSKLTVKDGSSKIDVRKFTDDSFNNNDQKYLTSPQGTINIGPAFNVEFVMAA